MLNCCSSLSVFVCLSRSWGGNSDTFQCVYIFKHPTFTLLWSTTTLFKMGANPNHFRTLTKMDKKASEPSFPSNNPVVKVWHKVLLIFSGHRWRARTTNYTPDNWQLTWFRFLDLHHLAPAVTLINRRGLFSDYPPASPHLLSPSHSVANHWNLTLIFRFNKHQPQGLHSRF